MNQRKGENDYRKYFMINLHETMLPTSAGVESTNSWSPVLRASNWAIEAGTCPSYFVYHSENNFPKTHDVLIIKWAAPCKNMSLGIYGQQRPRSTCADAQSDQGLHCLQTESLDTVEWMNGEQKTGWYFLNLHILRTLAATQKIIIQKASYYVIWCVS